MNALTAGIATLWGTASRARDMCQRRINYGCSILASLGLLCLTAKGHRRLAVLRSNLASTAPPRQCSRMSTILNSAGRSKGAAMPRKGKSNNDKEHKFDGETLELYAETADLCSSVVAVYQRVVNVRRYQESHEAADIEALAQELEADYLIASALLSSRFAFLKDKLPQEGIAKLLVGVPEQVAKDVLALQPELVR